MAFSCLFVFLIGKHFQNSFHHAMSLDNQGFDAECLGGKKKVRHYQEHTGIFHHDLPQWGGALPYIMGQFAVLSLFSQTQCSGRQTRCSIGCCGWWRSSAWQTLTSMHSAFPAGSSAASAKKTSSSASRGEKSSGAIWSFFESVCKAFFVTDFTYSLSLLLAFVFFSPFFKAETNCEQLFFLCLILGVKMRASV